MADVLILSRSVRVDGRARTALANHIGALPKTINEIWRGRRESVLRVNKVAGSS